MMIIPTKIKSIVLFIDVSPWEVMSSELGVRRRKSLPKQFELIIPCLDLRNSKFLVLVIYSELITPNSPHPPLSPLGRGMG
jgi:hypothetical protein